MDPKFDLFISLGEKNREPREILKPPMADGKGLPLFGIINTLIAQWPGLECTAREENEALSKITEILGLKRGIPDEVPADNPEARKADRMLHQHLRKAHYETGVYGYILHEDNDDHHDSRQLENRLNEEDFSHCFSDQLDSADDIDHADELDCPSIEPDIPLAPDSINFTQEILSLVLAAKQWLSLDIKGTPNERYKAAAISYFGSPGQKEKPAEYFTRGIEPNNRLPIKEWLVFDVFNRRREQVSSCLYDMQWKEYTRRSVESIDGQKIIKYLSEYPLISDIYSSHGLLPLAWMEVYWSIKNNVYAAVCRNCGQLFAVPDRRQHKKEYCSDSCEGQFGLKMVDLTHIYNSLKQKKRREKSDLEKASIQKEIENINAQKRLKRERLKQATVMGVTFGSTSKK